MLQVRMTNIMLYVYIYNVILTKSTWLNSKEVSAEIFAMGSSSSIGYP